MTTCTILSIHRLFQADLSTWKADVIWPFHHKNRFNFSYPWLSVLMTNFQFIASAFDTWCWEKVDITWQIFWCRTFILGTNTCLIRKKQISRSLTDETWENFNWSSWRQCQPAKVDRQLLSSGYYSYINLAVSGFLGDSMALAFISHRETNSTYFF